MFGRSRSVGQVVAALVMLGAVGQASAGPVEVYIGGLDGTIIVTDGKVPTPSGVDITASHTNPNPPLGSVLGMARALDGTIIAGVQNYGSPPGQPTGPGNGIDALVRYNPGTGAFTNIFSYLPSTGPLGVAVAPATNGAAWSAGDIFVTSVAGDFGVFGAGNGIERYAANGSVINHAEFTLPSTMGTLAATNLAFNPQGTRLFITSTSHIAQTANAQGIFVYDGASVQPFAFRDLVADPINGVNHGTPLDGDPTGLAVDGNNHLFVAVNNKVEEYDATTGDLLAGNILPGVNPPFFINGLTLGPDGMLYVSDAGTNAITRYSLNSDGSIATLDPTFGFAGVSGFGPTGMVVVPVPEPAHVLTALFGVVALGGLALRRRPAAVAA